MKTYDINLNNNGKLRIHFEMTTNDIEGVIWEVNHTFRDIEILDADTGEIIYNSYKSDEIFEKAWSEAETLRKLLYMDNN